MNRPFAARGVVISLVVLVGIAALIWWLLASGRIHSSLTPTASKAPADQSKPSISAPSTEKPASTVITEANKAIKDLGDRLAPSTPLPPASADSGPGFDVARVEPNGEAVIAGRAAANASIELLVDGQVHEKTIADASGAFVFVPKPLPPGNYSITLRATAPDGKVTVSKSGVAVAVVAPGVPPVAALTAPPPVTVQTPSSTPETSKPRDDAASKPATKGADLRIESVEAEAGGGLFVSGRAAPGSRVRLYMNEGYIATGTASPEGRVSFSIQSGVRPGDYRIRLDQLSVSDSVASRVEMPFRAPATVAAVAPSVAAQTPPTPANPDSVVASRQPAPAASIVSPSQPPVVAGDKPAAPAAAPSQATPSQPDPKPEPKQLAGGPAAEPQQRSAAPTSTSRPASEPAPASPATGPSARTAESEKGIAPKSQPSAPSPAVSTPGPEPKVASNTSPRITSPTKDRRGAVVIPRIDTRLIIRGDNLWRISEATYGLGKRYTVIFGANRDKIRDPDLIYPGQIFVLPKSR